MVMCKCDRSGAFLSPVCSASAARTLATDVATGLRKAPLLSALTSQSGHTLWNVMGDASRLYLVSLALSEGA